MVLVAVLGLCLLGNKNFSMDELDTIFTIKDWSTLGQVMWFREGNMWLYYTLLFGWSVLGQSEFVIRAFSVVWAVATIPVAYALARTLLTETVARITVVLLSVHVFLIFNAQNARGYTLVLFLTTLSSYLLAKYVTGGSKKYLWAVAIFNGLAVYAHMYALLVIAAQFVSLMLWAPNRRSWLQTLPAFLMSGLMVLPLAMAPSFYVQPVSWIPVPDIRNLIGTFIVWAGDFWPMALICATVLGIYIWRWWRRGHMVDGRTAGHWKHGLVWVWVILPVVISFAFSVMVKPLYISAYFFVCLVPFVMLVALAITSLERVWLRNTVVTILVVLSLVRLVGWYGGSHTLELVIPNTTEEWDKTAAYLAAHTAPADAVLFFPPMELDKVTYYLHKQGGDILAHEVSLQPYFLTTGQLSRTYDNAKLLRLAEEHDRVWFVLERVTGKETDAETEIIEEYLKSNYSLIHIQYFEFLEIYQYERASTGPRLK